MHARPRAPQRKQRSKRRTTVSRCLASLVVCLFTATSPSGAEPVTHPQHKQLDPLGDLASHQTHRSGLTESHVEGPANNLEFDPLLPYWQAAGRYINFESPSVKPLALSDDGSHLFVAHQSEARILSFNTQGASLEQVGSLLTGLDPVALAVEPGSSPTRVWTANFISDSVNVHEPETGQLLAVVEVSNEPINVVFSPDAKTVFIVCQDGNLWSIDAATHAVLSTLKLPANTPRGATIWNGDLVVSALHSGNNTTIVGTPLELEFADGSKQVVPALWITKFFNPTRDLFLDPLLSPWPDPSSRVTEASPPVLRLVPDSGVTENNPWLDILSVLDDGTGNPKPEHVAGLQEQFLSEMGLELANAEAVLKTLIEDYLDTQDNDLLVVDISDPSELALRQVISSIGSTLFSATAQPATSDLWVTNLEPRNLTRMLPNLKGHFVDHEIVIVPSGPQQGAQRIDLHAEVEDFHNVAEPNLAAQSASLANPLEVVFNASGSRAYVLSLGSDRVGVIDTATREILSRVELPRGPRGLVIDPLRSRLYVFSRTDAALTVLDVGTDTPQVLSTTLLATSEPDAIRQGRDFLYSARYSNNFASSCASCHIDGDIDFLAWDLGDPNAPLLPAPIPVEDFPNHPVKGPMMSQSLRGLQFHKPFHWRGDQPTLEDFNPLFESFLGGSPLSASQFDLFAEFIRSMVYPPNANRTRDNGFKDPLAASGESIFANTCGGCHQIPNDGARKVPENPRGGDGGTRFPGGTTTVMSKFGQTQLVPQLRGFKKVNSDLYNGFGIFHDGRLDRLHFESPLERFLQDFEGLEGDPEAVDKVEAYVLAFPTNVMPVVGWQLFPQAPVTVAMEENIRLMLRQSELRQCDVLWISYGGQGEGGLYLGQRDGVATFKMPDSALVSLDEILERIDMGETTALLAVPPGSGPRIGSTPPRQLRMQAE